MLEPNWLMRGAQHQAKSKSTLQPNTNYNPPNYTMHGDHDKRRLTCHLNCLEFVLQVLTSPDILRSTRRH